MAEVKSNDMKEIRTPSIENYQKILPEKGMTIDKAKSMIDHIFERPFFNDRTEKTYTTIEERIKQAGYSDGDWDGKIGDSKFYPNDINAKADLEKYDQSFIEYKGGNPDFCKVSEGTVEIDNMTSKRPLNFENADINCSELWNMINRDGRNDWSPREVKKWRQENKYSWHERIDRKTMDLIPRDIHTECKHFGGVAECIRFEKENGIEGGFDE